MLDVGAKRRLVGAVVLVVLAVIFLPMWVEDEAPQKSVSEEELRIPAPPQVERGRPVEIFPSLQETGPRPVSRPEPESPPQHAAQAPTREGAEPALEEETPPVAVEVQPPPAPPKAPAVAAPKPETTKSKPVAAEPPPAKPQPAPPAAPKPVPPGLTSWVVQVAALSTPEAAQRLESDLRGKGFHAFVEKVPGEARTLWRVRVGPEVERARADALAAEVKRRTGLAAIVRKYRG